MTRVGGGFLSLEERFLSLEGSGFYKSVPTMNSHDFSSHRVIACRP